MWWWLSFIDPAKPPGQNALGVCIVEADSFDGALAESWRRECNPGGEVVGVRFEESVPPPQWTNRRLSPDIVRRVYAVLKERAH